MPTKAKTTIDNAEQTGEGVAANTEPQLAVTPRDTPAPKGASIDDLKDHEEIEIVNTKTGQTYGVSVKAYKDLYEPLGFEPTRKADNTLLPGDPRAPEADTVPADAAPPVLPNAEGENVGEGQPGETGTEG